MNLLKDPWLPLKHKNGEIRYHQVSSITSSDIIDLALPRADFQGAAYQFLIGLLHTALAPEDIDQWLEQFSDPPSSVELDQALAPFVDSFFLDSDGPRFMQDYNSLENEPPAPASSLLIDAPGANTIKNNTDHFVKAGRAETFCPDCSAIALFTMQINAPSGGKGYRTGLRGGGPLTTLVMPESPDTPLWQKLWLNVLDRETFEHPESDPDSPHLFPWMGPTRTSEHGEQTRLDDVHPFQMFWSMPRRFRLAFENIDSYCDLCGRHSHSVVSKVRVRNYGINYDGPWRHPLTPYRRDPKKPEEPPISIKGQPGGIGYRHWESLVLEDKEDHGNLPAPVVLEYPRKVDEAAMGNTTLPRIARIWAFGYDMDNMKPRCWYAAQVPLIALPPSKQDRLLDWLKVLLNLAQASAMQVRNEVKGAWFKNPKEVKGDLTFVENRFWERTEHTFYQLLKELAQLLIEQEVSRLPPEPAAQWFRHVQSQAIEVFDEFALSGPADTANMKRITHARNQLLSWFTRNKTAKDFRKQAGIERTNTTNTKKEPS